MNAFKLVFLAKICFKVVAGGVKIGEAIVFLVDPYYLILPYLMILKLPGTIITTTTDIFCIIRAYVSMYTGMYHVPQTTNTHSNTLAKVK